jgi:hypothetical protein
MASLGEEFPGHLEAQGEKCQMKMILPLHMVSPALFRRGSQVAAVVILKSLSLPGTASNALTQDMPLQAPPTMRKDFP